MHRKLKKILEREFAIEFLKTIGENNSIDEIHLENPDIIVKGDYILGIEVTQIYCGANNQGVPKVAIEGSWDQVIEECEIIWSNLKLPNIHASISFNPNYHFPKLSTYAVAEEIVEITKKYLPNINESYWSDEHLVIFPGWLIGLDIHRYEVLQKADWTYDDASWSPELQLEDIETAINKKEKLRPNYLKNCDIIWLLLVLYGARSSGNFDIEINTVSHPYKFEFDKVYLFDALPKKTWELEKR